MTTAEVGPTVMVVDDLEDVRELTRVQLMMLGCRVVEAADGRAAVELAGKEHPALILMDMTLPVLDGMEAARLIRGLKGIRDVVIVALTELHGDVCRGSALASGCDYFFQKPLRIEQLSGLLERHFGNGR